MPHKIRTAADLAAIATSDFAANTAEHRQRLRFVDYREPDAVARTRLSGGRAHRNGARWGEATGTQIEVRSIFYNLPRAGNFFARKIRRAGISSISFISGAGHPEIAFRVVRDERVVFQLPARGRIS